MVRFFYLVIISLLFFCTSKAQTLSEKIDNYISIELKKFNIPSVSVAVINVDNLLFNKTYGKDVVIDRQYYIGSVSKSLTALGVLKLIEKDKLDFDSKLVDIIPNLKIVPYNDITIRHLLNQTSGIKKVDGFITLPELKDIVNKGYTINNVSVPGTTYQYSNLNYTLLGLVIEKVSGMSYQAYMQDKVFFDLNMPKSTAEIPNNVDVHYQYLGVPIETQQLEHSRTTIPAGFIISTTKDLANYVMMNLNNGRIYNRQVLGIPLLKQMHKVWNDGDFGYAMGWKQGKFNNQRMLQHLGATATSNSGIFIFPDDKIGLVVLTNSNSMWFTEELMEGLLHIITNNEPKSTSRFEYYFRFAVVVIIAFLIAFFTFKTVRIVKSKQVYNTNKEIKKVIIHIVLIILLFIGFPIITKIPFTAFLSFQPDIGFLILAVSIVPIVLSLLKIYNTFNQQQ